MIDRFLSTLRPKAAPMALAGLLLGLFAANAGSPAAADEMPDMAMPHMHGHAAHVEKLTVGEPGRRAKVDRTVAITMKDLSFEPNALDVRVNETIRFVIANKGELDHEFVLGDVEAQIAHRKEMVEMSNKGHAMHHDDDPNGVSVKAGKTGELIWKFTRAGRFEFDCNIPGHFESGMAGAINVVADKRQP